MSKTVEKWFNKKIPAPKPKSNLASAAVISIFNQKGGVGKTTSTTALAAALAEYGRKVLVIDFDPQSSLTVGLTGKQEIEPNVYHVVMGVAKARDVLVKTNAPGVDLVPSAIDLSAAEGQLMNEVGREFVLQRAIADLRSDYDYILIDCLPSLGILAINALVASESIVIPLQCEFFAMKGISLLEQTLERISVKIGHTVQIAGVLPTMYKSVGHHKEVLERVLAHYGETVFHTAIPETIKFSEANSGAMSITTYAAKSPAAEAYRRAASEIINRIEGSA